ncbi:MAG TPA: peptidyl-prolyl cis-trans isomerase, partial [Usitatibacter sp.]|nr:peptidyl-prolyl cis-trans isomerase [Usitatibacter sp.]
LDQDPAVQKRLRQVQEDFLADLYLKKAEKDAMPANMEQRARELYAADADKYTQPPQVNMQQIVIDLKGRTREMALKRAQEVHGEAKSGKDFLELALKYTDEQTTRGGMRGELGWNDPDKFVAPVRDELAKMKKGDISPPVETEFGYVVLKLVDRKPAEKLPFDAVKERIIKEETARIQKDRLDALIREIRSSPTAHVDPEKVKALVIPVDADKVKRALEEGAKK